MGDIPRIVRPIDILLVEDNPGDARLLREMLLEAAPENFELAHVDRLSAALDHLAQADPDVVLVLPCGFDIERTRPEMAALTRRPEWAGLRAVVDAQVYLTDGNQYFNRPGPRLKDSLEMMAEMLHPNHFQFGHEGSGWMRFAEPALT